MRNPSLALYADEQEWRVQISDQINDIIDRRHQALPGLRRRIERWMQVAGHVDELKSSLDEWEASGTVSAEIGDRLAAVRLDELGAGVAEVIESLRMLEARCSRRSVNVGVSGSARVGKSTLLQSITDLSDAEIPTGTGVPVTAVRSRIFHSTTHRRAIVTLHTFESFRAEVLAPFHRDLGIAALPATVEEFARFRYPAEPVVSEGDEARLTTLRSLLDRLELIQRALPTYASLLVGGEREIPFDELRSYVAYPTAKEEQAPGGGSHRYLAVREARIECPFRHAKVQRLGIADMPGLGEVTVNAELHHVAGLRDEVDVVVAAVRTAEGMAYWRDQDANTLELLGIAKGAVELRDFVFLAINDVPADRARLDGLRSQILRKVNRGVPDQHLRVVEADFKDPEAVQQRLLSPVLEHLADRLPVMDRAVEQATLRKVSAVLARLRATASDVDAVLSRLRAPGGLDERVNGRADELRKNLAMDLYALLAELGEQAEGDREDAEYVAAVEAADLALVDWIEAGFGEGAEAWQERAFKQMVSDGNAAQFAAEELTHIRVEIGRRFAALDDFFSARVVALWGRIAATLGERLGVLLSAAGPDDPPQQPDQILRHFVGLLTDADEPCTTLAEAVRGLLDIRLDYRTQLYPRVRRELSALNFEVMDPSSGEIVHRIATGVSPDGAEALFREISLLATEASYQTRRALIDESVLPARVLFAAAEHFDDWFIRSADSKVEFGRLARSYRDDIWPGEFRTIGESNARVTRVRRASRALTTALRDLGDSS